MPASLPIVDISPFLTAPIENLNAEQQKTVSILRNALLDHGFFYLTGHGIPTNKTDEILSLARTFFQTASQEEKHAIRRQNPGIGLGDGARGYQVLGENVTQGSRDYHEGLDLYKPIRIGEGLDASHVASTPLPSGTSREPPYPLLEGINLWPSTPPNFQAIYEEHIVSLLDVGTAVLLAVGYALDLRDPAFFVKNTRDSFWVMRAIGYPPLDLGLVGEAGVSCGEHSDYGCLTLLLQDETKGALQVRDQDTGGWISADPLPGAYVVNVGDMVERWTAGLVKSTRHRVVHKAGNYRVSVPFFMEPDRDCLVKPLEECIQRLKKQGKDVGHVEQDKGIIYWDHLVSKVGGNFYGGEKASNA